MTAGRDWLVLRVEGTAGKIAAASLLIDGRIIALKSKNSCTREQEATSRFEAGKGKGNPHSDAEGG